MLTAKSLSSSLLKLSLDNSLLFVVILVVLFNNDVWAGLDDAWLLCRYIQCSQVHATRCTEAAGEHANAVGADQRRLGALPHHRSHHLCQRNTLGG